jgi:nucleoside-diphosphate-sugar epimerase
VITVLGGSGFIGSHLIRRLRETGTAHRAPARGEPLGTEPLGTVIYSIGLTADFRERPLATVEAHVSHLTEILRHGDFDRLVYLSSTRVYRRSPGPCLESDVLHLDPGDPDDLYGLSKALGESVVLGREGGTVVRLSNVYGPNVNPQTFLGAVIGAAVGAGVVVLGQTLDSAKDYVSVADVVDLVLRIAQHGRERVYNVAGGANVSHGEILDLLRARTGCAVEVRPGAVRAIFPPIAISRVTAEFGHRPARLLDDLPDVVASFAPLHGART